MPGSGLIRHPSLPITHLLVFVPLQEVHNFYHTIPIASVPARPPLPSPPPPRPLPLRIPGLVLVGPSHLSKPMKPNKWPGQSSLQVAKHVVKLVVDRRLGPVAIAAAATAYLAKGVPGQARPGTGHDACAATTLTLAPLPSSFPPPTTRFPDPSFSPVEFAKRTPDPLHSVPRCTPSTHPIPSRSRAPPAAAS
ncbi:hypothetical protein CcaCcLH18_06207 [Colletotrichum camelliae]|nr:hypothetical protein CcaCcLH18_06207 [Colletotrichum camelliae]